MNIFCSLELTDHIFSFLDYNDLKILSKFCKLKIKNDVKNNVLKVVKNLTCEFCKRVYKKNDTSMKIKISGSLVILGKNQKVTKRKFIKSSWYKCSNCCHIKNSKKRVKYCDLFF